MLDDDRGGGELTSNRLLAGLPDSVRRRLRPAMQPVRLGVRDLLHSAHERIEHVYFLLSGWASLVVNFDDGFQAEVGLVGSEGMTGLPALHGAETDITDAMVQAPGHALRLEAQAFRKELEASPEFLHRMLRYSEAMRSQAKQAAACNGHHALEQRLARWLLMAHDRAGRGELPVTQEVLAMMLCVHRPSLTSVSARLQRAGLIRHSAGTVVILDRPGLERTACECYATMRARFRTLLA